MTSPAPAAGASSGGDGGLADPLLAKGNSVVKKAGAEGRYWVAADEVQRRAAKECGGEDGRPLLFRTYKLRSAIVWKWDGEVDGDKESKSKEVDGGGGGGGRRAAEAETSIAAGQSVGQIWSPAAAPLWA